MNNVEKYKELKKISDEIIDYITTYNKNIKDNNKILSQKYKIELNSNLAKKEYNDNIEKYNKNLKRRQEKLRPQLYMYDYNAPHSANFEKEDFVINLMGINPNVPEEWRKCDSEESWNKDKENHINKYKKEYLDMYYLPNKKNILEKDEMNKYERYICNNISFVDNQYNFWIGDNSVFKKLVKMSWQKYDLDFLKQFYEENKVNKYNEVIVNMKEKYEKCKVPFENKYFIFTDLVYVSNPKQDNLAVFFKEVKDKIRELFYKQLEYYNSTITIVANAKASTFVMEEILQRDTDKWERIVLDKEDKFINFSNLYKFKDSNKEQYVYLTTRYWGREMDKFSKNLFKKEMIKLMKHIDG